MADILSTLRELRSLEEKRAHGTLSPEEEARFQELQNAVSSRGPQSGAPSPKPIAPAAPVAAPAAVVSAAAPVAPTPSIEEAPFVDAELTDDGTAPPQSPSAEATVVQAVASSAEIPPVEPPQGLTEGLAEGLADTPTEVAPAPSASPASDDAPVPMSAAELRQWNASFQPPEPSGAGGPAGDAPAAEAPASEPTSEVGADVAAPSVFAAPPAEPAPPSGEWLAPTPLPLIVEPPLEASEAPGAIAIAVDLAPEPTVIADDAPMLWTPPEAPAAAASPPDPSALHDDGWTASVSWSAGIPPPDDAAEPPAGPAAETVPEAIPGTIPETMGDDEPTRLAPAASVMSPAAADAYEPSPGQVAASSAEVSTKKLTPIGEAFAAGESRVVVHTLGGVQKRGTLVDAHMNADFLELRLQNGEREMVSTAGLKAVFFVVPIGQEVPKPVGDPVTVTLQDGHQLSGLSPDYQVGAVGFFLCPTDQRSRTAKIYIYAGSVKAIS